MAHRIETGLKRGVNDARARALKAAAADIFGIRIKSALSRTVYKVDAQLSKSEIEAMAGALCDPTTEVRAFNRLRPPAFDVMIEIGFKPGVTDNVGRTARTAIEDAIGRKFAGGEDVYTGAQYFIRCPELDHAGAKKLGENLLANTLIQTVEVFSAAQWKSSPVNLAAPAIHGAPGINVKTYDFNADEKSLAAMSETNIWSLSLDEMLAIRKYFNRAEVRGVRAALGLPEQPTDVEIECLAQSWSEHCKHKIFSADIAYRDENGNTERINSLFRTYIKAATEKIAERTGWMVSVFSDNAGIIRFNDRLNLVYKVETHNTPSALDPYGGAITGIVGVNRDPMGTGMGAAMLCNVWGYCLGSPFYSGPIPEGLMHPRRIRNGVHQGVIDGGNQSGIPWARGWEIFDERYIGKPLVYCGTVGVIPAKVNGRPSEEKQALPGDLVVTVGGRIGKDGIHGATFSSADLAENSPAQAVQIGDPITQRKMYEFLLEARDKGLFRSITDNGAGGLSCSAPEMARDSGGAEIDLALAPLKYEGMQPWEILLSEAQERMTLAVPPEKFDELRALAGRRDVELAALGVFNDSGAFTVRHGPRVIARLDMDFIFDGCPKMSLEAEWTPRVPPAPELPAPGNRTQFLLELMASPQCCSREYKSRQYDGEVKGLSVVKPYCGRLADAPSDATVMRVEYGSDRGVMLSESVNPFLSDIDAYHMTTSVIDEAVRRMVGAGAALGTIAGLDNFCWPDPVQSAKTPDGKYKLAQLVRANKALYDVTTAYGVPCISGKDSCKNDSTRGGRKISIPPTLLFSTIAPVEDVRKTVTVSFKKAGDLVYAVGLTDREMGGSAFCRFLAEQQGAPLNYGGAVPKVDTARALEIYRRMNAAIDLGILRSAHSPGTGGMARALAVCALGGDLGVSVDLRAVPAKPGLSDDEILFSESNSRFVASVAPEHAAEFARIFDGIPAKQIGTVTQAPALKIRGVARHLLVNARLPAIRKAFKKTLHGI